MTKYFKGEHIGGRQVWLVYKLQDNFWWVYDRTDNGKFNHWIPMWPDGQYGDTIKNYGFWEITKEEAFTELL